VKNIHACGNPAVHFSSVLAENVIFALEYGRASLLRKILYTILTFGQGWVFAMAKTIFAGTVEKTSKNRQKLAKSQTP